MTNAQKRKHDEQIAVQIAALGRAQASLKTQMHDSKVKAPVGAHRVHLSVAVDGDVIVGEPTTAFQAKYKPGELLLAVVRWIGHDPQRIIDESFAGLRAARKTKTSSDEFAAELAGLEKIVQACANKRRLRVRAPKAGSTTGKPEVTLAETHSGLAFTIDGEKKKAKKAA